MSSYSIWAAVLVSHGAEIIVEAQSQDEALEKARALFDDTELEASSPCYDPEFFITEIDGVDVT